MEKNSVCIDIIPSGTGLEASRNQYLFGVELGVCQKRGGARLFAAAGQPQGGGDSRGARIT